MFNKKIPKQLIYLSLIVIPFIILFYQFPKAHSVKTRFTAAAAVPFKVIMWPVKELKKLVSYRSTHREYQRLKSQMDALKARLVGLEEVSRENMRYERLLAFKRTQLFSSTAAIVIGRDPTNWNSSLLINKGSDDGLKPGMPVVNALGVVGKIAEVSRSSSKVVLVNDPSFSVAALVQEPRESGLLSGSLSGLCRLRYLPDDAQVKAGDLVITSRLSATFPEGLLIGKVVRVNSGPNFPTTESIVQPAVNLAQVEEVIVILAP